LFRGRIEVTSTVVLHLTLNISETVRDSLGVGKLGRCKLSLGKLGLGKLGWGKLGRDF